MSEFCMPMLGSDMEDGIVVEWLVKPGDVVARGDIVAVVETQKGAIEIEIFENGVVREIKAQLGETVPVGAVLALIDGEHDAEQRTIDRQAKPPIATATELDIGEQEQPPETSPSPIVLSPTAAQTPERKRVTPAARHQATTLGVNLDTLTGTGPGGAITLEDVEKHAGETKKPHVKPGLDPAEMQKAVAAAMARSKREIPHFYVSQTIDLGEMTAWLTSRNATASPDQRILPIVPVLKAVALAVTSNPSLNGRFQEGNFEAAELVHIGVAVALRGGGLIAPALHDVSNKSIDVLMKELRDLVSRARTGRLRGSEIMDPTITLTSLGEGHAESLSPVIFPPQVAIIGAGAIVDRAWVRNGEIVARPVITLTVAADHRVSDGRAASHFLGRVDALLQQPEAL